MTHTPLDGKPSEHRTPPVKLTVRSAGGIALFLLGTTGHGIGDCTVTWLRSDPPRSWTAQSTSPRLDVGAEGEVLPTGSGSRLIIRTDLRPRGLLRPLAPLLLRCMHAA
jgi:hypothetical protein